jgi:Zn-dependent alcohol dehydrogenase
LPPSSVSARASSPARSSTSSHHGSANATVEIGLLARLAADGRFALGDVVTHVCDLDGIEDAFGRLRRGEGLRTLLVLDEALAGRELSRP